MYKAMKVVAVCGVAGVLLGACGKSEPPVTREKFAADAAFQKKLQEQLLDAKPGSVVDIPAGIFNLTSGLTLRGDGVTIRGAGMEKTVLSFKGQVTGPEGLLVYGNNFTIEA